MSGLDRALRSGWEAAQVVWHSVTPLGDHAGMPPERGVPGRVPVVLVHGALAHPEMWRPLTQRLRAEGWPRVERVAYPTLRSSPEEIGARIAAVVEPLARTEPVDLVGHSLGAVASRAWIKRMGGAAHVRRFVSLGGPHFGSPFANIAPPRLRDMIDPDGDFLARLNEDPEPVPTTVIRAAWDEHILPPTKGTIAGIDEIVIERCGHNGLLFRQEVLDLVIETLRQP